MQPLAERVEHHRVRGMSLVALWGCAAVLVNSELACFLYSEYGRRNCAPVPALVVVFVRLDQMASRVQATATNATGEKMLVPAFYACASADLGYVHG
jgi:hypothetical protein